MLRVFSHQFLRMFIFLHWLRVWRAHEQVRVPEKVRSTSLLLAGQHHLMMSGSGDLVLDVCRYFWDGDAIRPLDDVTRRKISDFFNRADAVGQCVTFSFVPVPVEFAKKESVIFEQSSSNPRYFLFCLMYF